MTHQVVVGGTSGIGEGIALCLAQCKADVVIVGRSMERGSEVLQCMRQLQAGSSSTISSAAPGAGPSSDPPLPCDFVACDASLLSNVAAACVRIAAMRPVVDLLVLTPGIASMDGRTETSEGLDRKLAVRCGLKGQLETTRATAQICFHFWDQSAANSYLFVHADPLLFEGRICRVPCPTGILMVGWGRQTGRRDLE